MRKIRRVIKAWIVGEDIEEEMLFPWIPIALFAAALIFFIVKLLL
jgi:hypothetical protein